MLAFVAWGAGVKPLHSRQGALNAQLANTLRTRAALWTTALCYSPVAEQSRAQIRQGFSPWIFNMMVRSWFTGSPRRMGAS